MTLSYFKGLVFFLYLSLSPVLSQSMSSAVFQFVSSENLVSALKCASSARVRHTNWTSCMKLNWKEHTKCTYPLVGLRTKGMDRSCPKFLSAHGVGTGTPALCCSAFIPLCRHNHRGLNIFLLVVQAVLNNHSTV